jgi:murein DD-endopeptidase MepM/ murein hydrolase activator NlpD
MNDDPALFAIIYLDQGDTARRAALQAQWLTFNRLDPATQQTYKIWSRPTNHELEVVVDHCLPPGMPSGRYRVETFVPGIHATTQRAIFSIVTGAHPSAPNRPNLDEQIAIVDMHDIYDVWTPLGEYSLEPAQEPQIGRVRQYDISREDPPTEISFGPVRWVPLDVLPADGRRFDSPVGTPEERNLPFPTGRVLWGRYPVWCGDWFDANPFLSWYTYGAHTGADLNLPGVSAADKGKPIYSIGDGKVTYAGKAGTWGNIIVIEHADALVTYPDGHAARQMVYSRYGHVDPNILVRAGEAVTRGQNIGFIGLALYAVSGWHLHFDVSFTDILRKSPAWWPNLDAVNSIGGARNPEALDRAKRSVIRQVVSHFIDPLRFIQDNH